MCTLCVDVHVVAPFFSAACARIAGVPFFIGCIAYNVVAGVSARPRMLLQVLVVAGAVLQVFGKAAKFSCFKPCEEMVYIGLDEESRTKGAFVCMARVTRVTYMTGVTGVYVSHINAHVVYCVTPWTPCHAAGKAAIDVVGAQTGKSAGSVLQQGLLLASGGHVAGMLPFLLVIYASMLQVADVLTF